MLRITHRRGTDHDKLLLEGKLLKEWIEELQQTLAQARRDGPRVALDLSGLLFVDHEGACYLRDCRTRGVPLMGASPFVAGLLDPPPPRGRRPS